MGLPVQEGRAAGSGMEGGAGITDQQLGLKQAEERLYRDYIHRLVKVRIGRSHVELHATE